MLGSDADYFREMANPTEGGFWKSREELPTGSSVGANHITFWRSRCGGLAAFPEGTACSVVSCFLAPRKLDSQFTGPIPSRASSSVADI
jgi:hypothetical protein